MPPPSVRGPEDAAREVAKKSWRTLERTSSHVVSIPLRSAATTGRAVLMTASVLRYSVIDAISLRLPFGELVVQAWTL